MRSHDISKHSRTFIHFSKGYLFKTLTQAPLKDLTSESSTCSQLCSTVSLPLKTTKYFVAHPSECIVKAWWLCSHSSECLFWCFLMFSNYCNRCKWRKTTWSCVLLFLVIQNLISLVTHTVFLRIDMNSHPKKSNLRRNNVALNINPAYYRVMTVHRFQYQQA